MSDGERTAPIGIVPPTLAEGRYETGELLGSGGMGLVVAARDTVLGRDVAIKLLADNLAFDADARSRFEEEARSAGRLQHPNIVQVLDVGEESGRPYLVMERSGPSLAGAGPLAPAEVERLARQVLDGLGYAHDHGVLHRDLKPANILRAADGRFQITDFGVARAADGPELTRTGLVLGTERYLAPERFTGAPATPTTDLYAVGVTLLELLTGEPYDPAEGVRASELPAGTSPGLATTIARCLAAEAERRPRSAGEALSLLAGRQATAVLDPREMLTETVAISADEPAPPEPGPTSTPATGWLTPARAAVIALAVLLLVLAASRDGGEPDPAPDASEAPASTESVEVPAFTSDAEDPAEVARDLASWLRELGG